MNIEVESQEQLNRIELDYIGDQIEELKGICRTLQTSPILRLSNNLDFIKENTNQIINNQRKHASQYKDFTYFIEKYSAKIEKLEQQVASLVQKISEIEQIIKN